jgi:predicted metalloprotease with PDZ domain
VKKIIVLISFILLSNFIQAQQAIEYTVSLNNALHHEAQISMFIPEAPSGKFQIKMAQSSPGRYAKHEFGKNIYDIRAFNADGSEIKVKQTEGNVYEITEHQGKVKFTYTLFGNHIDGTYTGIDHQHAHLNIPATFMYVPDLEKSPITIKFLLPQKSTWNVYSQLKLDSGVYSAPNFQYFMDSPIEISDSKVKSWDVLNKDGLAQKINLVYHGKSSDSTLIEFTEKTKKIVKEAQAVFGDLPAFDFKEYSFLIDILPGNNGDGMEHRNSTVITLNANDLESGGTAILNTVAHEFFHVWNTERIRPKSLEPFDFQKPNLSEELWFAEGFTQYYGNLILKRAEIDSLESFVTRQGEYLNYVLNSPAASRYSAVEVSRRAIFTDAGTAIDKTNHKNIFTSYYIYGGIVALALDLTLQSQFTLSLDDYMKSLWQKFGATETPYQIEDLQKTLGELTQNEDFAKTFFNNYIYGIEKADYRKLLAQAGLMLQRIKPFEAHAGNFTIQMADSLPMLASEPLTNNPLYAAGLINGDYFLKLDTVEVKSYDDIKNYFKEKRPGDKVEVVYKRGSEEKSTQLILTYNPAIELITFEKAGMEITPEIIAFREKWLNSKVIKH